jgi:hypothetical protein
MIRKPITNKDWQLYHKGLTEVSKINKNGNWYTKAPHITLWPEGLQKKFP